MFRKKKEPTDLGRHRTLQPANRGTVFSYHANRSARQGNVGRDNEEVEQPAIRVKRKRWWHKVSNLAILALVGLLIIVSLRLDATPHVIVLGDTSGRIFLRQPTAYTSAAHRLFADSLVNGNKVTIDASGIAVRMRAQFPELEAVSVSLPVIGHQPIVYIQPATPQLVLSSGASAFVIDRSGRALLAVGQVSDKRVLQSVPVVTDESGLGITPGHVVLDSASVAFITEVVGQLHAQKLTIASMSLPKGSSELDVRVQGISYSAKFNLRGSAREEAGTFVAVKQQLEAQHKTPGQYIDVRVSGRAYYK